MPELFLHGEKLGSIFDLLGHKENDITFSVGWALSYSPCFLDHLVRSVFPKAKGRLVQDVLLQEHVSSGGYTDIELRGEGLHCIIEAKRGWSLPTTHQLKRYAARIRPSFHHGALLVLAECSPAFAGARLPKQVGDVRVYYRSWRQVHGFANRAAGRAGLHERALLRELSVYLEGLITVQNQTSNLVYVVSLAKGVSKSAGIPFVDMVTKRHRYWHPYGVGGWPKDPPNYLGFRYNGRLQSVFHVEKYEILDDMRVAARREFDKRNAPKWGPGVLYYLGKPVYPFHEVRTGSLYPSGRVWVMLDLLLTSKTISQARDLTKKRLSQTSDDHQC